MLMCHLLIKAQEQEIYYKQVIDIASEDATKQMKEVENEDSSIELWIFW